MDLYKKEWTSCGIAKHLVFTDFLRYGGEGDNYDEGKLVGFYLADNVLEF